MSNNDINNNKERGSIIKIIVSILTIFLPIWAFIFNSNLDAYAGYFIYNNQYYAIFLCIALLLVFFMIPAKKNIKPLQWYDFILATLTVITCLYFFFNYEQKVLIQGGVLITKLDIYMSIITIIIVLEAVRRTIGYAMVLIFLFFLVHVNYAYVFPSLLYGPKVPFEKSIAYMLFSGDGIFGKILGVGATYIIAFCTLAGFLIALGEGKNFSNLALALAGHVRGGAAKVAVIASALFGTISGNPTANIGLTGTFTIPLMKRLGFSPAFAAAVETTASIGGAITPPIMGVMVFLAVEMTGIPYAEWIKAAVFPALLYYFTIYCQIGLYTKKNNVGFLPASELPNKRKAIIDSIPLIVIMIIFLYLIAVVRLNPLVAVYIGIGLLIFVSIFRKDDRFNLKKLVHALEESTKSCIGIIPLLAGAGVVFASISLTGVGLRLVYRLLEISGGSLLVLSLLTALTCYLLGMGVSAILSYILLTTLVAPALLEFGVPIIVTHFFIMWMMLSSFVTPPYAIGCAFASSLAEAKFYPTCLESMKLSVLVFLFPITFVFDPALLLQNTTTSFFIFRLVVSIIAIYFLCVGFQGFFLRRSISRWERIVWTLAGLFLFVPQTTYFYGGCVIGGIAVAIYFINPVKRFIQKTTV